MLNVRRWIRRVRNAVSGRGLAPLERLILEAVRRQLLVSQRALWDRQVAAINRAQRLPDGREVNLYRMRNGRASFEADLGFANEANEALIARVVVEFGDAAPRLVAEVWCVRGFLAALEYDRRVAPRETHLEDDLDGITSARATLLDPVDRTT